MYDPYDPKASTVRVAIHSLWILYMQELCVLRKGFESATHVLRNVMQ